jgi:hypothetical protein
VYCGRTVPHAPVGPEKVKYHMKPKSRNLQDSIEFLSQQSIEQAQSNRFIANERSPLVLFILYMGDARAHEVFYATNILFGLWSCLRLTISCLWGVSIRDQQTNKGYRGITASGQNANDIGPHKVVASVCWLACILKCLIWLQWSGCVFFNFRLLSINIR